VMALRRCRLGLTSALEPVPEIANTRPCRCPVCWLARLVSRRRRPGGR
jgi:hypothetical protein